MRRQAEGHVFIHHIVGVEGGHLVGIVGVPRGVLFLEQVRALVPAAGRSQAAQADDHGDSGCDSRLRLHADLRWPAFYMAVSQRSGGMARISSRWRVAPVRN
jgi:hypothetical protein